MKWLTIIVLIVSLLFSHTYAVQAASWEDLDQKSEMALQLTKQGKYETAIQHLDYFSEQFLQMRFSDEALDMEQVHVLSASYQNARNALLAEEMTEEKRIKRVMQFRLAVDAVTSRHQPMWAQLKPVISDTIADLKAASNHNNEELKMSYEQFHQLFTLIYPSLVMDKPSEELQVVNATLEQMNTSLEERRHVSSEEVEQLEKSVMNLFMEEQQSAQTSIMWIGIILGGMILLTLFYVAWRKYNGQNGNTYVH